MGRNSIERRTNRATARVWAEPEGAIVYTSAAGGAPFPITAIFDDDALSWGEEEGTLVQTRKPMLDVELSEVPAPAINDTFTVAGHTDPFRVVKVEDTANDYTKLHCVRI